MIRKLKFLIFFASISLHSFGQTIDSLKLKEAETSAPYTTSKELLCVTPHAYSFYSQTDLFESLIGKISKKEFQSFTKKGDEGSILYFEFEKPFEHINYLEGLLWGEGKKASKAKPDEYLIDGNILVIWSFKMKSELKQTSMTKVKQKLL